jgi:hypothetical protein
MNEEQATGRNAIPIWVVLLVAVAALVMATVALTATLVGPNASRLPGSMMGTGGGMMGGRGGMMGSSSLAATGPQPGTPGFIAGTKAAPRVIRVVAAPGTPSAHPRSDRARRTVAFEITTMGPFVHEFMVGPADAVAADREAPEVADIGMMQTKPLTYVRWPGRAFACHARPHEAACAGDIVVLG